MGISATVRLGDPGVPSGNGSVWPAVTHGSQITIANVGVPAGVSLTAYSGPLTITTAGTTITGKTITGDITVRAANVTIRNCVLNGTIEIEQTATRDVWSFTVIDSQINAAPTADTAVGAMNFTLIRCRITGSRRSVYAGYSARVEECYLGGQVVSPDDHASCIRQSSYGVIIRNNMSADAPEAEWGANGGVSATLTGYGDFETVEHNDVINNLFRWTDGGYGAYGGSTAANYPNAHHIRFMGNRFERNPTSGYNGFYGNVSSFDSGATGNVWSDNKYTDGVTIGA